MKRSLSKKIARLLRVFHTVRHLQPRQAWYFFLRRGIGARRVAASQNAIARRDIAVHPALKLEHLPGDFSEYAFNFLNRKLSFPRDAMNWRPSEVQRLWRYNLHYFDFLREESRPFQEKIELINDWIKNNPQGSEPAWEPYTASLRIVNWCLFFWSLPSEKIAEEWLQSLHTQARWLERNLELHILANHYFENIKAMLFAALFFDDLNSTRWLAHFQKELALQLREQTLSDGGHYERSPQYHCILLEDDLDLFSLLSGNSTLIDHQTLAALSETIDAALHFLALIVTPTDEIPLFNDSANGAASRPSIIFEKAKRLGFDIQIPQSALIDLPDSGLFGWKSDNDYFLIDGGSIGPSYQPGHTHCDFLSFVLMIDGQWVVVDSGVCEYEPGALRQYVRSTRAHNTIVIDGQEQSEIWGEFRVGRRAQRIDATLYHIDNQIRFEGAYRGFPTVAANIIHRRRAILTLTASGNIVALDIIDTVDGADHQMHNIENVLHLHPFLNCHPTADHAFATEIYCSERKIVRIENLSNSRCKNSWFCSEFGKAIPNQILHASTKNKLPITLSYQIAVVT